MTAKVLRSAFLCIIGATNSTPTSAIETLLNLLPSDIYIKGKAKRQAYRLKCVGNCRSQNTMGDARITTEITNIIFDMGYDTMTPKLSFEKPFKVAID